MQDTLVTGAFSNRLRPDALVIYLFHGVIARQTCRVRNYTRKHLEAPFFRELLVELTARGTPLSMGDVLASARSDEPFPPRAFAVTFDDGFENNASVAAPILADLGIPATFYVTTGFVEDNAMSWIDRVEHCFETLDRVECKLPWRGPAGREVEAVVAGTDASKIRLLDEIRREVKGAAGIDAEEFTADLCRLNGLSDIRGTGSDLDLKLSWPQVRDLDEHPLFSVGGHTHTHRIMSRLPEGDLAGEIDTSLRLLEEKAGVRGPHYSYPEGLANCFDRRVIAALRARGVECCPTAIDGENRPGTDPFMLRRVMVA